MGTTKNRDLAKELVEFLLKKEMQKRPNSVQKTPEEQSPLPPTPEVKAPGKVAVTPSADFALDDVEESHISAQAEVSLPVLPSPKVETPPEKAEVKAVEPAPVEFVLDSPTIVPEPEKPKEEYKPLQLVEEPPAQILDSSDPEEDDTAARGETVQPAMAIRPEEPVVVPEEPLRKIKREEKARFPIQPEQPTRFDQTLGQTGFVLDPGAAQVKFDGAKVKGAFESAQNIVADLSALRVAQARIVKLEAERDQLREESDQLLSHVESLQRRISEASQKAETGDRKLKERQEIAEEEKAVFKGRLNAREKELEETKKILEDLRSRYQADLRKIRVRERELEARQEIIKAENSALLASKDEMILDLKRQVEQIQFELENFKAKSADLNMKIKEFNERNHRTVKALRLALSVLETGEEEKGKTGS